MKFTDAKNRDELTDMLTAAALNRVTDFEASDYDKKRFYGNPAADVTNGQDFNWSNNLAPANAVKIIRHAHSLDRGVADVSIATMEACYEYSPDAKEFSREAFIGLVKAVAGRFGVGAAGEEWFAQQIRTYGAQPGDESAGIDVRTVFGCTVQVKTMDNYRSKSKKDADILVWVQPGEEWTWEVKK